jgi:hypothetical protein
MKGELLKKKNHEVKGTSGEKKSKKKRLASKDAKV